MMKTTACNITKVFEETDIVDMLPNFCDNLKINIFVVLTALFLLSLAKCTVSGWDNF